MSDTWGPKFPAFSGMSLAIPFLLLLRLPDGNDEPKTSQEVFICILLVFLSTPGLVCSLTLVDIALSLVSAPSISEISYISKQHGNGQLAQAYALFNMSFSAGFLVGPLWGGFVTEKGGWNTMVTSLSGLALLTLAPIVVWTGGPSEWKAVNWHRRRIGFRGLRKRKDNPYSAIKRNIFHIRPEGRRTRRIFDQKV